MEQMEQMEQIEIKIRIVVFSRVIFNSEGIIDLLSKSKSEWTKPSAQPPNIYHLSLRLKLQIQRLIYPLCNLVFRETWSMTTLKCWQVDMVMSSVYFDEKD